jgi:exodeoxyribonuclease VII large subunit
MSNPLLRSLFEDIERRPLTVSELNGQVRQSLEKRFGSVWVEGEISNFKAHQSGHWYFTIKDEFSQIRATCFRSRNGYIKFRPLNGLQVRARGTLTVYEPRGEYELCIESLDPVGAGAVRIAFEQLRDRLSDEGLFAQELKRPIPFFPRRVAVITSPTGAAIKDVLSILSRRTRTVNVLVVPTRVQGEGAGREIASAIQFLNRYNSAESEVSRDLSIDVCILARGGGSAEDLWAFNEEVVARAIRASKIPVISAIGHETDFTISDFASDLRTPTPSAAAEMVAASEFELISRVSDLTRELVKSMRFILMSERSRVQNLVMSTGFDDVRYRLHTHKAVAEQARIRLYRSVEQLVRRRRERIERADRKLDPLRFSRQLSRAQDRFQAASGRLENLIKVRLDSASSRFAITVAELHAMSPLAVLSRGYAIAQSADGRLIRESESVAIGDKVRVQLSAGALHCRVEEKEDGEEKLKF